jgi:hypothetical protein
LSTFSDYLQISTNLSRYQKMTASDPTVAQATKYYQANIGSVTSAAQLVNNPRLFNYVMNAFGLSNMTYAKTLIQKAMEQGTTKSTALANTLNNPQILALVKTFNFSLYGKATTKQTAVTSDVVSKYVTQTLDTNQGKINPGVQMALYFQQHASSITDGYSILADKNLLTVVQTTLGISSYTSAENIDTQAAQFNKLLTYSDFKSPTKLKLFLERFTAQYDYQNPTAGSTSSSSLVSVLFNSTSSSGSGISASLLMSINSLKLGGA